MIHEIESWQTQGKDEPVLVRTRCGIYTDGPRPFKQSRSDEPTTCLWCAINRRARNIGFRQTWVP